MRRTIRFRTGTITLALLMLLIMSATAGAQVEEYVQIQIPEQARLNNEGETEIIPAETLLATLIRPGNPGDAPVPRPTILTVTGYSQAAEFTPASLVDRGYNALVVDARGTGSSTGVWTAFDIPVHYDNAYIIDRWIPDQPWSDGKVGMIGASYMGIIQLMGLGLMEQDGDGVPKHLKAIFPITPMSDGYRQPAMAGGLLDIEFMSMWLVMTDILSVTAPGMFHMDDADQDQINQLIQDHHYNFSNSLSWLTDMDNIGYSDFWRLRNPSLYFPIKPKGGWTYSNGHPIAEGATVLPSKLPVFLVNSWYDLFTAGGLEVYQYGLCQHDPSDKAMIIGPWSHFPTDNLTGFDSFANGDIAARWFDWKIKGVSDSYMKDFPVMLYVMGENRWRQEKDWPLPESRTEERTLYLSKRKPSWIWGDWFSWGNFKNNYSLIDESEVEQRDDASSENPVSVHNPYRMHGWTGYSASRWLGGAPTMIQEMVGIWKNKVQFVDERSNHRGALTFTTKPLEEDVEIVGPLTLTFWARTKFTKPLTQGRLDFLNAFLNSALGIDNPGTDGDALRETMMERDVQWIVELNDIEKKGKARNITSGWLSANRRAYDPNDPTGTDPEYTPFYPYYLAENNPDPSPIEEGKTYRYVVELWPTCNVFKAGHRIRVSILNSDVPHILPILRPSENTLIIDQEHRPRLDFKTTVPGGEGVDWKWVRHTKGTIKQEYNAADDYLVHGRE